ncbi:MAG: glycosyltransferase family 2 protein, partial [Coraliomargarita sp.]
MSDYHTDSPVVFCIFNRPETTRRVFEQIARARPPALHIVADAPRSNNPDDVELCQTTRQIAENVTWDCDVTLDYAETNLGCRERIYSGISNAFKQFEFAIILEDDCLPSNDFFRFIDTLRNRYSEDPKVTHISGTALVR